jgi:hypothetical protein
MKNGLAQIVGRRISGVAVARSPNSPRHQVFLVFEDGTRFEFWGDNFSCCSGVDEAAGILPYVRSAGGEIVDSYGHQYYLICPSPPWPPSRTRLIYAAALTNHTIDKAKKGQ